VHVIGGYVNVIVDYVKIIDARVKDLVAR